MEFQLLLALPNRSLCKEFIKKRCEFVEKREIERIRLETRFIRIKEGTTRGEGEQEEEEEEKEMKGPKEEKKRCKSCKSKLPLFFSTPFVCSLCKAGYSCKKCWCLKEQVSLCKECFNLLTPTTTMVSIGNSLLLLEDYNKFTAIKKRIESLLFQFSTTDKSGTRNEILSLFSSLKK